MHVVILAAGKGSRFKQRAHEFPEFGKPKPMIDVMGKSLITHTVDSLPPKFWDTVESITVAILGDHPKELRPFLLTEISKTTRKTPTIIALDPPQLGNLYTAYQTIIYQSSIRGSVLFLDADNLYNGNGFLDFINRVQPDVGLIGFNPPDNEPKWCYAILEGSTSSRVTTVVEKQYPVGSPTMLAMVGAFYFKDVDNFMEHAGACLLNCHDTPSVENYMSDAILSAIRANDDVYIHETTAIPIGTPEDVEKIDWRYHSVQPLPKSKSPKLLRICFDLDGTLCETKTQRQTYADVLPIPGAIEQVRALKNEGHYIIIHTARHMRTCNGNVGQVLARQGKVTLDWLEKYNVPYDEIHFGKPHYDISIDDKGLHHNGTWTETAHTLKARMDTL